MHRRVSEKEAEQRSLIEKHHADLMAFLEAHDKRSRESYEKLTSRVEVLETWKWAVVGAATAIGWLIAEMGILEKFL